MGDTKVTGRVITVKQPVERVFSLFSDLNNFVKNLPDDMRESASVVADSDSISGKVQGFDVGITVAERLPFSEIKYVQTPATPISFNFYIHFSGSESASESSLYLELDAQLGTMMKMMLGGKIQEVIDKFTDEIEKGLNFNSI